MKKTKKIHLVTYATQRFRHRQIILGLSARLNRVADSVTGWTSQKLCAAGFRERVKNIRLDERGSGFWAWKPFIIQKKLAEVAEGDIVFYCDVGRRFPIKQLDQPVDSYLEWMGKYGQTIMPGVENPWDGPMILWTKRDAFILTGMDRPEVHSATLIQAGFSFWRAGDASRDIAEKWMSMCAERQLISDDPSNCGLPELPGFKEHRHDQTLMTLCCLKEGLRGMHFIDVRPPFESGDPSKVSEFKFGDRRKGILLGGRFLKATVWPVEQIEFRLRRRIKFSAQQQQNSLQS